MSCMLGFTICLYLPLWVLCCNKIHQIIISLSCKFTAFCISPFFHTISVVSGPGEAVLNGTLFTVGKKPGPGCSKLTTPLVNVSLNFQKLISQICQYFLLHFSTKNFSVFGYKVVKDLS